MARLTWRQRLIAVAIGAAVAVLEAYAPAPKFAHATTDVQTCSSQAHC